MVEWMDRGERYEFRNRTRRSVATVRMLVNRHMNVGRQNGSQERDCY